MTIVFYNTEDLSNKHHSVWWMSGLFYKIKSNKQIVCKPQNMTGFLLNTLFASSFYAVLKIFHRYVYRWKTRQFLPPGKNIELKKLCFLIIIDEM